MHKSLVSFFISFPFFIYAQPKQIQVHGNVFNENTIPLNLALIEVYTQDTFLLRARTDTKGHFDFYLPFGNDYVLVFSKNKHYKKIVNLKAEGVKREDVMFAQKFGEWEVFLFEEVSGVDASIFEEAVGEFYFDWDTRFFDWDANYFEKIRQELADFEKELAEKKQEALQNRKDNYSSGFEALNKKAKPVEEILSENEIEKIEDINYRLINAYKSIDKRVTETIIHKDKYTVTERTVTFEGSAPTVFRKVVHIWGGKYYFRNGVSITELQFELLTAIEYDFLPSIND